MPLINKIAFGAWGLVAACFAIWGLATYEPDFWPEYMAAASQNQTAVHIDRISCLSIDPHKVVVDRKEYSDPKLVEAIADTLSVKRVLFNADYATCPWHFFITVVPGTDFAVRYNGLPARYLISIGICERFANGSVNPNKCFDKNIYVFNRRVPAHELFSIALIGLARLQASEWEAFQSEKSR